MKRLLTNKKFITVLGTIICFLIAIGISYAFCVFINEISQWISENINIQIETNN